MPTSDLNGQAVSEVQHGVFASDVDKARVWELLAAGDLEAAKQVCRSAQDKNDAAELHGIYGYLAFRSGEFDQAIKSCRIAIDRGIEDWLTYMALGASLEASGDLSGAYDALAKCHRLSPERSDVAILFLKLTMRARGIAEAKTLFERIRQTHSSQGIDHQWSEMVERYVPADIEDLIQQGKLDIAESRLADLSKLKIRRAEQWLFYLKHYRKWWEFTSKQHDRRDPARRVTLTVLLITYNHGRYIAQALDGILQQKTSVDIQVHVVDDCSTDNTQAVVLEYQRRYPYLIKTFFNSSNIGLKDPPQQKVTFAGMSRIKTDYLAILEGDDFWNSEDKLEKQINVLEKNPILAACAHNTIKFYQDSEKKPHQFHPSDGLKSFFTIDDAVSMQMFFHTTSIIYRNVLMGKPSNGWRSKWSCDIYNTQSHLQYGELAYLNEDMSMYRAHAGGLYSTMKELDGRIFNIEGLIRYNLWFKLKYCKLFALSINRLSLSLLVDCKKGDLAPLSMKQWLRYRVIVRISGLIYDWIDRHPRIDPACILYGESEKISKPRREILRGYNLA